MKPSKFRTIYQRLMWMFPSDWHTHNSDDFINTVEDNHKQDELDTTSYLFDLIGLAIRLQLRRITTLVMQQIKRLRLSNHSPFLVVLALSVVLCSCTYYWSGNISFEFVVTTTLVVLVPGIGVFYTITNAIAGGRDAGITAATACTLGILPHLLVAYLGLSGIMQLGASAFEIVRWLGVAYLAWMGICMLREKGAFQFTQAHEDTQSPATSSWTIVRRGVLINVLNPKLTLFFFAFLPQFLTPRVAGQNDSLVDLQLIGLSSLFMLLTLVCFILYALIGLALRNWASRSPTTLNFLQRSFGVLLLGFATRLALTER